MIDQARLQELLDDFGAEDFAEIVEAFLEEAEQSLDELGSMLGPEAEDDRKARLHFLKGCARNVGANALGDECETLESGERAFTDAELTALKASFGSVRTYFEENSVPGLSAPPLSKAG